MNKKSITTKKWAIVGDNGIVGGSVFLGEESLETGLIFKRKHEAEKFKKAYINKFPEGNVAVKKVIVTLEK